MDLIMNVPFQEKCCTMNWAFAMFHCSEQCTAMFISQVNPVQSFEVNIEVWKSEKICLVHKLGDHSLTMSDDF